MSAPHRTDRHRDSLFDPGLELNAIAGQRIAGPEHEQAKPARLVAEHRSGTPRRWTETSMAAWASIGRPATGGFFPFPGTERPA